MSEGHENQAPPAEVESEREPEVLFESEVGSRRASSYLLAAFCWLLFLGPAVVNPAVLLLLPYSVPMAGLALWLSYRILTNHTERLAVFRDRIAWGSASTGRLPHVLPMRDVLRLTVEQSEGDGPSQCCITVHLKDGTEQLLPPGLVDARERDALVHAIQQAAPGAFVRYRS